MKKFLCLSLVVASCLYANEWEDILKSIDNNQISNATILDDGNYHSGKLFYADITYNVNNLDGTSGNFSDNDTTQITITAADGTQVGTGYAMDKDELKVWAEENADKIINAIFSGEPTTALGGQSSAFIASVKTSQILQIFSRDIDSLGSTGSMYSGFRSKIVLDSETSSITDRGNDIEAKSETIAYEYDLRSGNNYGLIVYARDSKTDDSFDSEQSNLAILPFYKFNRRVNSNLAISTVINLTTNFVYMDSTMFPEGAGYLEYGAGVGAIPSYRINDKLSLNANLGYQYMKKYVPGSLIPDNIKWLADAINNLDAVQVLNTGIGSRFEILDNWKANINVLYISQLGSSINKDRDSAIYYFINSSYQWKKWSIRGGYKTVGGVSDYTEHTYNFNISYKW